MYACNARRLNDPFNQQPRHYAPLSLYLSIYSPTSFIFVVVVAAADIVKELFSVPLSSFESKNYQVAFTQHLWVEYPSGLL